MQKVQAVPTRDSILHLYPESCALISEETLKSTNTKTCPTHAKPRTQFFNCQKIEEASGSPICLCLQKNPEKPCLKSCKKT